MIDLDRIANSDRFASARQGAQAEMVLWGICRMSPDSAGASIQEVVEAFAGLALAKPNGTRLKEHFKKIEERPVGLLRNLRRHERILV